MAVPLTRLLSAAAGLLLMMMMIEATIAQDLGKVTVSDYNFHTRIYV